MNKTLDEIFPNVPTNSPDDVQAGDVKVTLDPHSLDLDAIPAHVAVIMDGNGRWAKARGWKRLRGHKAGVEAVRETIRTASDLGVKFLTIYSFSSENWKRPADEVSGLMDLFAKTLLAEVDELNEENVRITTIGSLGALPEKTRSAFKQAWEITRDNTGLTLVVAVNYGGRQEILDAVNDVVYERVESVLDALGSFREPIVAPLKNKYSQALTEPENERKQFETALKNKSEQLKNSSLLGTLLLSEQTFANGYDFSLRITEADFTKHLYTANIPDPDLLIRTSGEVRVSNFLLWQIAYSEFVVSDVYWPDFDRYEFLRCLLEYQSRNRRFGGVN